MAIWFKKIDLQQINKHSIINLASILEIRFTKIGDDFLEASMPVKNSVKQPYGILHGGASCVLAETVGSVAGSLCIDTNEYQCVGLEINANHVKAVSKGEVIARGEPLHIGRTTQLWDIKIRDAEELLVCVSRLTLIIKVLQNHKK